MLETKNKPEIDIFENHLNHLIMDISSEKAEVMKRFEQVHDISLIRVIKNILDCLGCFWAYLLFIYQ